MTPDRWQDISRIFNSARELEPEARAKFLIAECGDDQNLREEVQRLIESDQKAAADEFIERPAVEGIPPLNSSDEEREEKSGLEPGLQLGAYRIIKKLGEGGMGEVYLAEDTRLGRQVAIKILPPDVATDTRRLQRFRQEARVASSLNQPNILTVFEFGEINSLQFLATEYVDGETLRSLIRTTKLSLTDILEIGIQIFAALDAAHEAKIVHRDMKPENVMIRRRDHVVKVLDFGLAKLTEPVSTSLTGSEAATEVKTAAGHVLGTVNYMSPEQAQGHRVDERSDVWSAGVIIYEMVSRQVPFKGMTPSHTIVQILEKDPPQLAEFAHVGVPAELQRIVSKSMAKNADERYQTAKDMLIDLRNLRKQLDLEAEIGRSTQPEVSGRPVITGAAAVATNEMPDSSVESRNNGNRTTRMALGISLSLIVVTAGLFWGVKFWRATHSKPTVSVPAPNRERKLTYSVIVQKYRDDKPFEKPFQLAREMLFERGYRIRLNISSPQAGYLYVINEGPHEKNEAPKFVVLFPSSTSNSGSAFVPANGAIQMPEESWFRLDSEKGTENLWLIFSSKTIPELETTRAFANAKNQGLISDAAVRDNIQSFLEAWHDEKANAEQDEQRKETTLTSHGDVLIHIIRLEHQ